jgi:pyrroline-5-carboxylate reductase
MDEPSMTVGHIPRIGILGTGQMATALAKGWLAAGLADGGRLLGSDPLPAARESFQRATSARAVADNREVIAASELLLVAVKPQSMNQLLAEVRAAISTRHLVVSIVTGVTLRELAGALGNDRRLVRVVPNTPCLVGASASAYALSESATAEDAALVQRLLEAVGKAFQLPEDQLDAVTGLSGSGPAFVYLMIEALSDGGVRVGLPRAVATALAAQTVLGAARMALETGTHPGALKDMVASPGGTTIAGLHALERGGVRGALIDAVEAAAQRATELGKQ